MRGEGEIELPRHVVVGIVKSDGESEYEDLAVTNSFSTLLKGPLQVALDSTYNYIQYIMKRLKKLQCI